jgi:sec-independent protein translocase protein TatA
LIQIVLARVNKPSSSNRSEQAMMGLDNPVHIAFLLVLLLLVFGAKRLPEMGRSLGAGLRGFKESISGETPVAHAEPARIAGAPEMPSTTAPLAESAPVRPTAQV